VIGKENVAENEISSLRTRTARCGFYFRLWPRAICKICGTPRNFSAPTVLGLPDNSRGGRPMEWHAPADAAGARFLLSCDFLVAGTVGKKRKKTGWSQKTWVLAGTGARFRCRGKRDSPDAEVRGLKPVAGTQVPYQAGPKRMKVRSPGRQAVVPLTRAPVKVREGPGQYGDLNDERRSRGAGGGTSPQWDGHG